MRNMKNFLHAHLHAHTRKRMCTCTNMHARMHTQAHARCPRTHTHTHAHTYMDSTQTDLQSSPSAGGVLLSTNARSGSLLRDDSVDPVCVPAFSMATVVGISSVSVVVVDSLALVRA